MGLSLKDTLIYDKRHNKIEQVTNDYMSHMIFKKYINSNKTKIEFYDKNGDLNGTLTTSNNLMSKDVQGNWLMKMTNSDFHSDKMPNRSNKNITIRNITYFN